MEKIRDAIAKAKKQSGTEPRRRKATSVRTRKSTKSLKEISNPLDSIVYTETKVVKINPDTLLKNRIVSLNKTDALSWVIDSLRTQVLQKMEENNWKTLAIISPTPEAGKTVIAINLAISIAQQPHKTVALVDFDLRRPQVANYLGLKTDKSINDILEGKAEVPEAMVNPSIPHLVVLPTNRPVLKSSENLSSELVLNLVEDLKERYDSRVIIFDLPPLLNADDALVLLPQVDCALLVIADGMSKEEEIQETMRLISNINLVGVVFNKAEVEARSYY